MTPDIYQDVMIWKLFADTKTAKRSRVRTTKVNRQNVREQSHNVPNYLNCAKIYPHVIICSIR
jgi:hypothetical protein